MNYRDEQQRNDLIRKICERAESELNLDKEKGYKRIMLIMDLRSLPDLDWYGLLHSTAEDFAHDISGIRHYMDRTHFPGTLTDHFSPRFMRTPVEA